MVYFDLIDLLIPKYIFKKSNKNSCYSRHLKGVLEHKYEDVTLKNHLKEMFDK